MITKFRVWDAYLKEMYYATDSINLSVTFTNGKLTDVSCEDTENYSSWAAMPQDLEKKNRFFAQAFSGFKDKNGEEIYQGDILKLNTRCPETGYIDFTKGGFTFHAKNMNGTYLGIVIGGFGEDAIIIGNIYETPNLK